MTTEEQDNEFKDKKATALKYDPDQNKAPKIIAKGNNEVAKKIIDKAEKNDIPIHQDDKLVENLIKLDLEEEIPKELYQVVAEVLNFIYQLNDQT
ncbi:EscU/YscU/HrcU family type III secretion system export apparatus switch protein [Sporohalobacter salinus]|uniref:EscU/YscU/HrcU family type III secretion system export apparatus switch protein n=1 Tax=Sporohalobacter salinus TaxID=1494606 RepID=UPI00196187AA|nr:EscU/YscU/HrcU family type III secretion system export apparatus switch protein [Sporohalobacter salinus]MBM7623418.1 flagellar biosynthesis protein [Sporohalobacter salinus]